MLKTIVEFKFDDYQLYDQNLSAEDGNTLVQKTEDIAQYIYLSLIHISEPTRPVCSSRMPSSA